MSEGPHRMLPGSHERGHGPECRCGADWDRWNDRCCVDTAAPDEPADDTPREADHG
jgi:hypothetical protein